MLVEASLGVYSRRMHSIRNELVYMVRYSRAYTTLTAFSFAKFRWKWYIVYNEYSMLEVINFRL